MDLMRHNRAIPSVFRLAGTGEIAVTGALGWSLAHSEGLLDAFLADLGLPQGSVSEIRIEHHDAAAGGRTDIELVGDDLLVVVEGKAGWIVPGEVQLRTYLDRSPDLLIAATACTTAYAHGLGLPSNLDGVPVTHRSWRELRDLARAVRGAGRTWAAQLGDYLEDVVDYLHETGSNIAICVALGPIQGLVNEPQGQRWVDKDLYFWPHAKGWFTPPTYLAFRWAEADDGARLRTVRHVDEVELVPDLADAVDDVRFKEPNIDHGPHFVARLGPHIGPAAPVPYSDPPGYNPRARHDHIPIDLLLTSPTYKAAVAAAKRRRTGTDPGTHRDA